MPLPTDARLVEGASGAAYTGADLESRLARAAETVDSLPAGPVICVMEQELGAVMRFLAVRRAGRVVLPVNPALGPATLGRLVRRLKPSAVLSGRESGTPPPGYRAGDLPPLGPAWIREGPGAPCHPDLAVLMPTSGSSGTAKLARWSATSANGNAGAVVKALRIDERAVTITTLPLFYSFGLSVLHSHLLAGATVVVADGGVTDRRFWEAAERHDVTSLALVPHQIETLARMRWTADLHPALRTVITSGGAVRPALADGLHRQLSRQGGRLFLMYGMTEAGPRISVLDPGLLPEKAGSVGRPVDGTRLSLRAGDGTESAEPGSAGEIVCRGPNIMMGYASVAADLAAGDTQGGELATGDLGRLDQDGDLWLTGRSSRVGKVFGVRVNLDTVEHSLAGLGQVAAIGAGDRIRVFLSDDRLAPDVVARRVADAAAVHQSGVDVRVLADLPVLANGKIDYGELGRLA